MQTHLETPRGVQRQWHVVDADGKTLGRLAARIAMLLRGKHKRTFTPHVDCGDHVVVINAGKVRLTGNKLRTKIYHRHSGYPGGLKSVTARHLHEKQPTALVTRAVKGMLPKNHLGRQMAKKLKVYAGTTHPHQAQRPEPIQL